MMALLILPYLSSMWAAGALITALFGGDSIFAIQANRTCLDPDDMDCQIIEATVKGDLNELLTNKHWSQMSGHAVDMVNQLLAIDKNGRLDARAALHHPWFSNGKTAIEANYRNLISKWSPRFSLDLEDPTRLESNIESFVTARKCELKVVCIEYI